MQIRHKYDANSNQSRPYASTNEHHMAAGALRYYLQVVLIFTRVYVNSECFLLLNMWREVNYRPLGILQLETNT